MRDVVIGEAVGAGESLYLPLHFAMNLKLPTKIIFFKKVKIEL